jgi:hypothetical protein
MDDIIIVQPWYDDGKWFKRSYWSYPEDRTFSVDEYSDGDHEDADAEDLPSYEEVDRNWYEYHQYVAETGEDPLDEFFVKRHRTVKQVWYVAFANGISGTGVQRIKHGKRYYAAYEVPQHVKDYLMVVETPNMLQLKMDMPWKELVEVLGGEPGQKLHRFAIEHKVPVSEAKVKRELLKLARNAIRRYQERVKKAD